MERSEGQKHRRRGNSQGHENEEAARGPAAAMDTAAAASSASLSLHPPAPPASHSPRPVHARRNSRTGAAVGALLSSSQTFSAAQLAAIHEPMEDDDSAVQARRQHSNEEGRRQYTNEESDGAAAAAAATAATAVVAAKQPSSSLAPRPPPITASLLPSALPAAGAIGRRRGSIGSGSGGGFSSGSIGSAGGGGFSSGSPGVGSGSGSGSGSFGGSGSGSAGLVGPDSSGGLDFEQPLSASATLSSSAPRSHAARLLNSQRHIAAPPTTLPPVGAALSVSITSSHAGALSLRSPKGSGSGGSGGSGRGSGNNAGAGGRGSGEGGSGRGSGNNAGGGSRGSEGSGRGSGNNPSSIAAVHRDRGSGGERRRGGSVGSAGGSARSSGGFGSSSSSGNNSSGSSARSSCGVNAMPVLLQPLSLSQASGSGQATPLSAKMMMSPHASGSRDSGSGSSAGSSAASNPALFGFPPPALSTSTSASASGSGSGTFGGFPPSGSVSASASGSASFVLPRSPSASGSGILISPAPGMNSLRLGPAGSSGPLSSSFSASNVSLSFSRSRSQSKETSAPNSKILQSGQHVSLTASSVASPRSSLPLQVTQPQTQPSDPLSIALARMHTTHPSGSLHDAISSPDIHGHGHGGGSGAFSPTGAASAALHSPSPARKMSVASLSSPGGGIGALLRTAPVAITAASTSAFQQQQQAASPSSAFSERRGIPMSSSYSSGLSSFHPHHQQQHNHGASSASAVAPGVASSAHGAAAAHGGFALAARSSGGAISIPSASAAASSSASSMVRAGSFPRTASLIVLPPLTPSSHPATPGPAHQPPDFDLELDAVPRAQQPQYYNQQRARAATMSCTAGLQAFQAQHAAATAAAAAALAAAAATNNREPPPPHMMTSLPRAHGSISTHTAIPPRSASVAPAAVAVSATASDQLVFSSDPSVGVGLLMTDKLRARHWGSLVGPSDDVLAASSIDPRDLAQAQDLHPIPVLPLSLPRHPKELGDMESLDVRSPRLEPGSSDGDGLDSLLDSPSETAEEAALDIRSPRPPKDAAAAAAMGLLDPHVYLSARAYTAHALPPDPIGAAAPAVAASAFGVAHRTLPSMDLADFPSGGIPTRTPQKAHASHQPPRSIDTAQKFPAAVRMLDSSSGSPSGSPSTSSSQRSDRRAGGGSDSGSGRERHSSVDSTIEALNIGAPPLLHHLRPLPGPQVTQHHRSHTLAAPSHNGGGSGSASFRLDEGLMTFTPSARSAMGGSSAGGNSGSGVYSSVDVTPRADGGGGGSGSRGAAGNSSGSRGGAADSSSPFSARAKTPSGLALALAAVVTHDVVPHAAAANSTPSPKAHPLHYPLQHRGRACSCTPPLTANSAGSNGRPGSSADSPGAGACTVHGARPGSSGDLHSPVGARSLSSKPVRALALAPLSQPTSPLRADREGDSPSSPVPALVVGSAAAGGAGFSSGSRVAHLHASTGPQPARRPSLRSNIMPQPMSPGPQLR